MKLKEIHEDTGLWATKAHREIDGLLDSDINELNLLALPRMLSIVTGLSAARCTYTLKNCKSNDIKEQLKFFYENI